MQTEMVCVNVFKTVFDSPGDLTALVFFSTCGVSFCFVGASGAAGLLVFATVSPLLLSELIGKS